MTSDVIVSRSPAPSADVPASAHPSVSFVLVTFGTDRIVIDTLTSLVSSLIDAGDTYEVIVVDNPHPSGRQRTLRHLLLGTRGVRIVRPDRNLGFGGGCEIGALHARAEILCFVNPDITFAAGWFEPLVEHLRDPGISIVSPVLCNADGSIQEIGHRLLPTGWTLPQLVGTVSDGLIDVDFASAACWLMRRDEHERIGGFDPDYHPAYFEDADLAVRSSILGGRRVVDPTVSIIHHHGASTPDTPTTLAQHDVMVKRWPHLRWTQPRVATM